MDKYNEQGSAQSRDATNKDPLWFDDVFRDELKQLVKRRNKAGLYSEETSGSHSSNETSSDSNLSKISESLVGLALSGGGLRAATFSLGILQALRGRGLLRYFDYITSVSGGGYAAGYLATQVTHEAKTVAKTADQNQPVSKLCYHDLEREQQEPDQPDKDLSVTEKIRQAQLSTAPDYDSSRQASTENNPDDSIDQERFDRYGWLNKNDFFVFRDCGKYLARPWEFSARYILSTLPILLMFGCGLAACATFAAMCYRSFDYPEARDVILIGTHEVNDVLVAFLPTILLTLFWASIKLASVAAGSGKSITLTRLLLLAVTLSVSTFWFYLLNRADSIWYSMLLLPGLVTLAFLSYQLMVRSLKSICVNRQQNGSHAYSRYQKAIGFTASMCITTIVYFLIEFLPPFFNVEGALLFYWFPSVMTLVAFLGALISAIALSVLFIRRTFPDFYGTRMLNGWNGGAIATLLLFAGIYFVFGYLFSDSGIIPSELKAYTFSLFENDSPDKYFPDKYFPDKPIVSDKVVNDNFLIIICAVGVVLFLGIQWLYLGICKFSDFLFRLTILSIPAAMVICITNGILGLGYLDDLLQTADLPVVGQGALQQPLMIYVALATLALTQYKRLLHSQRPDASIFERVFLRMVLTGVIFGIPFLMFGAIAKENFSGYATHRDPEFNESDLIFANLSEWWNEEHSHDQNLSGAEIFGNGDKNNQLWSTDDTGERLNEYLRMQRAGNQRMFGNAGWGENSRGWITQETGKLARLAIVLGLSSQHRQRRNEYLKKLDDDSIKPMYGLSELRKEREEITKQLNARLANPNLTHRLGKVILIRAAAFEYEKPIDLPKVREYLFKTALEEMDQIDSSHNLKEQSAFRRYFSHATEHLKSFTKKEEPSENQDSHPNDSRSNFHFGDSLFHIDLPTSGGKTQLGDSHNHAKDSKSTSQVSSESFWDDSSPLNGKERLAHFNRLMLERLYPNIFLRSMRISTPIVVQQDQTQRCYLFIFTSLTFGVLFLLLPMNALSPMHCFYHEKIRHEFLQPDIEGTEQPAYRMSELADGVLYGGAIHLFIADIRLSVPLPINGNTENQSKHDKNSRFHHPYTYSPYHIGSPAIGFKKSDAEMKHVGVDDAVTISGAAVNPTAIATGALRWILTAFNLRLGEWIFNDRVIRRSQEQVNFQRRSPSNWNGKLLQLQCWLMNSIHRTIGPAPYHILSEWTRPWTNDDVPHQKQRPATQAEKLSAEQQDHQKSEPEWWESWSVGSVSDGGFIDFLGIEELLRRRCRILVVIDSSINSGDMEFSVLGETVRKARLDHGCEILDIDEDKPLDIARLKRDQDGLTAQHIIMGRILYPNHPEGNDGASTAAPREGLLVYVQMTRTGDENIDVTQFAHAVPSFPDHPTSDQFFDEAMVEAYRILGKHIGDAICAGLPNHSLLERAQREQAASKSMYLNIEELTEALIESYRIDCREDRVDRRDNLRHLPANNRSDVLNSQIVLPKDYPAEIRRLYSIQEFTNRNGSTSPDQAAEATSSRKADWRNEERFLRLYETDPNLRYRVQCLVNSRVHKKWKLYEDQDWFEHHIQFAQEPEGCQLSAYVIACHDYCLTRESSRDWSDNSVSAETDFQSTGHHRELPLYYEDRFQAGGRSEIISACLSISSVLGPLLKSKQNQLSAETDEMRVFKHSILTIADVVFRYRGLETIHMFLEFLIPAENQQTSVNKTSAVKLFKEFPNIEDLPELIELFINPLKSPVSISKSAHSPETSQKFETDKPIVPK